MEGGCIDEVLNVAKNRHVRMQDKRDGDWRVAGTNRTEPEKDLCGIMVRESRGSCFDERDVSRTNTAGNVMESSYELCVSTIYLLPSTLLSTAYYSGHPYHFQY